MNAITSERGAVGLTAAALSGGDKTVVAALDRIAGSLQCLDTICVQLGGGRTSGGLPADARAYPRQNIFVAHGIARGKVRLDGRGINVTAEVFDLSGKPIATRVVNASTTARSAEELMRLPLTPKVLVEDQNPVEEIQPTTTEKGTWTFADGSTLTAIGKGISHVWMQRDGSQVAADAANLVVVDGSGTYQGARGVVSLLGITHTPAGEPSPFSTPGGPFGPQHSIEVFQLSMGADV